MRYCLAPLILLAGCASDMQGTWPSLAPRAGEMTPAAIAAVNTKCPGCGPAITAAVPPVAPPPLPMPADASQRLAAVTSSVAAVEAAVPAQARATNAAIAAAHRDPARSGDAEVERSRFEALFLPLSIEERRLDVLDDDIAGKAGNDAVAAGIADLRARIAALQAARQLPDAPP